MNSQQTCNSKYHRQESFPEVAKPSVPLNQAAVTHPTSGNPIRNTKNSMRSYASVLGGNQATSSINQFTQSPDQFTQSPNRLTQSPDHFLGLDQGWMSSLLGLIDSRIQSLFANQSYPAKIRTSLS